jgi:hypothetical protein
MDEENPRMLVDKWAPINEFVDDNNGDDDVDDDNDDDGEDANNDDEYDDINYDGVVDLSRIYMIAAKRCKKDKTELYNT